MIQYIPLGRHSPANCRDVTAVVLDRPRHADLIRQIREAGSRIRLISDGDIGGAIEVAKQGASVDILMGIGGTPEGVIAGVGMARAGMSQVFPGTADRQ